MTDALTIVRNMGYPDSEQGYYVSLLREQVARQIERGMINRSGGTWSSRYNDMTHEERAKAQLAFDWAVDHGHSYEVKCVDPVIRKSYNTRTGKKHLTIRWKYIPAKIGDTFRYLKFQMRKPFLPINPYF